jgi:hypothetical protein
MVFINLTIGCITTSNHYKLYLPLHLCCFSLNAHTGKVTVTCNGCEYSVEESMYTISERIKLLAGFISL